MIPDEMEQDIGLHYAETIPARCTEIADKVVPEYRSHRMSCTGVYAKCWQSAWDAACLALGGDPASYRD